MIDVGLVANEPPKGLRGQSRTSVLSAVVELVRHRDLVWALTRRDFAARYKQTVLGVTWALVIPLITIVVFGVFVQRFARADTHGVPYVLWSYVGLLPWTFFSNSVSTGGMNLLTNQPLLNKIYSPREIYPIAGVLLAGVDALISVVAMVVAFVIAGFVPSDLIWLTPFLMLINAVFAVAAALLVSIVIVYVRDLRNIIPVILQLGLFATPIFYSIDQISPTYRLAYCWCNPMGPLIDSYRRVILFGEYPQWGYLAAGAVSSLIWLIVAVFVFSRLERGIVDII